MFAIAFDLVVADTAQHHPKGVSQAYADFPPADVRMNRQMIARHVPRPAGWPRRMAGPYRLPGAT
jgi:hypothetical protein